MNLGEKIYTLRKKEGYLRKNWQIRFMFQGKQYQNGSKIQ